MSPAANGLHNARTVTHTFLYGLRTTTVTLKD